MKIAIVGCGEVGRAYARAASAAGHDLVLVDPRPAPATLALAEQLGHDVAQVAARDAFSDVDQVWLCVTGDLTRRVCESLLDVAPVGATIVDLTTASAADKRHNSGSLSETGVRYVDVVIMGAVAVTGATTPLLGAGDGVEEVLEVFAGLGASVSVLPDARPGDAATIKLLRTILTKGLESLAVECLVAAEREGVRLQLYSVLGDIDDSGFANFINMLVRTHVEHARRRLHEVQRVQAQLEEMGSPSVVLSGSEARFLKTVAALDDTPLGDNSRGDTDAALAWLIASENAVQRTHAAPAQAASGRRDRATSAPIRSALRHGA